VSLQAEVEGGAEVGGFSLDAIVGLKASLDGLTTELRKRRAIEAAYQGGAVEVMLRGAAVSASTGNLIIGLGAPSYGRLWEVKHLTVGGALWTSSVAGQAIVVISPASGQTTPALVDIADQANSLPNVAYYSTRQLVVRHPNHLFVVILSPTGSTQYSVGGAATEFPDKRLQLETEN